MNQYIVKKFNRIEKDNVSTHKQARCYRKSVSLKTTVTDRGFSG